MVRFHRFTAVKLVAAVAVLAGMTASGSNTVFLHDGGGSGIEAVGTANRGGETGTLVAGGTGGGTGTPPLGGITGGTGI
jgi:hypothetical protein